MLLLLRSLNSRLVLSTSPWRPSTGRRSTVWLSWKNPTFTACQTKPISNCSTHLANQPSSWKSQLRSVSSSYQICPPGRQLYSQRKIMQTTARRRQIKWAILTTHDCIPITTAFGCTAIDPAKIRFSFSQDRYSKVIWSNQGNGAPKQGQLSGYFAPPPRCPSPWLQHITNERRISMVWCLRVQPRCKTLTITSHWLLRLCSASAVISIRPRHLHHQHDNHRSYRSPTDNVSPDSTIHSLLESYPKQCLLYDSTYWDRIQEDVESVLGSECNLWTLSTSCREGCRTGFV